MGASGKNAAQTKRAVIERPILRTLPIWLPIRPAVRSGYAGDRTLMLPGSRQTSVESEARLWSPLSRELTRCSQIKAASSVLCRNSLSFSLRPNQERLYSLQVRPCWLPVTSLPPPQCARINPEFFSHPLLRKASELSTLNQPFAQGLSSWKGVVLQELTDRRPMLEGRRRCVALPVPNGRFADADFRRNVLLEQLQIKSSPSNVAS